MHSQLDVQYITEPGSGFLATEGDGESELQWKSQMYTKREGGSSISFSH